MVDDYMVIVLVLHNTDEYSASKKGLKTVWWIKFPDAVYTTWQITK